MTTQSENFIGAQLSLFAIRASEMADRVAAGQIAFLDGIDLIYDAGVASGLVAAVGDDAIQTLMAAAFARPSDHDEACFTASPASVSAAGVDHDQ